MPEKSARTSFRCIGKRRPRPRQRRRFQYCSTSGHCGPAACDVQLDRYLNRVVHLYRPDPLTVDHGVVCAATYLRSDCLMRQLQRCRHLLISSCFRTAVVGVLSDERSVRVAVTRSDSVRAPRRLEPCGPVTRVPLVRTQRLGNSSIPLIRRIVPPTWRLGIVSFRTSIHNEVMAEEQGWFSYQGADDSHLSETRRQSVEERIRRRGPLLGPVQVWVYENGCEPFVTFPQGAVLGIETDQSEVAVMVARARTRLSDWE